MTGGKGLPGDVSWCHAGHSRQGDPCGARCARPMTAALRRESLIPVGNPAHPKIKEWTMTTLYVRDGGEFRKAGDRDVIERANAMQRRSG